MSQPGETNLSISHTLTSGSAHFVQDAHTGVNCSGPLSRWHNSALTCVTYTMSAISAKPSNFSCEMKA